MKQNDQLLELLQAHGPRIHRLLTRLTLHQEIAEDLLQELFLKLRNSAGFDRADDRAAYAVRTATNLAFEWRRKQKRRRETQMMEIESVSAAPSPQATLQAKEDYESILRALDKMSELTRQVVVMCRLEGHSYDEAARQIGKTPHQVRALLSKAVSQLKSRLGVPATSRQGGDEQ